MGLWFKRRQIVTIYNSIFTIIKRLILVKFSPVVLDTVWSHVAYMYVVALWLNVAYIAACPTFCSRHCHWLPAACLKYE